MLLLAACWLPEGVKMQYSAPEYMRIGRTYSTQGDHAEAIKYFRSALTKSDLGETRDEILFQLASSLLHARSFEEALDIYTDLFRTLPVDASKRWAVQVCILMCCRRIRRYPPRKLREMCEVVLPDLERAVRQGSGCGKSLIVLRNLMAQLEAELGNYAEAKRIGHGVALHFENQVETADSESEKSAAALKAGSAYHNIALWSLLEAERVGDWRRHVLEAQAHQQKALDYLDDRGDASIEARLNGVFLYLIEAKRFFSERRPKEAVESLEKAESMLWTTDPSSGALTPKPALQLQRLFFQLRIAQRRRQDDRFESIIREIGIIASGEPASRLWLQQDYAARFNWEDCICPLAVSDAQLDVFIAELLEKQAIVDERRTSVSSYGTPSRVFIGAMVAIALSIGMALVAVRYDVSAQATNQDFDVRMSLMDLDITPGVTTSEFKFALMDLDITPGVTTSELKLALMDLDITLGVTDSESERLS